MGIVKWEGSIYQFSVKSLLDFGERLEQFMVFININVIEGRRGPFIFLDEIFFDAFVVILIADLRSDVVSYSGLVYVQLYSTCRKQTYGGDWCVYSL